MLSSVVAGEFLVGLAALAAIGAATGAHGADDPTLRADLAKVSHLKIFFGHQSVGVNLLEGVKQLSAGEGVPINILERTGAGGVPPGVLAHGTVAENGNPLLKLSSFERALDSGADVDVAFVKFCFVDFNENTDVGALFARYRATIAALKKKHPRTTFVHVTVPLTTVQQGPKATLKRLLGRSPAGAAENARREEYNALLRETVTRDKEPLFDLARLESTAPDGGAQTFDWKGRRVPVLFSGYTDDGGHLNHEGQRRAARELVSVLASVHSDGAPGAAR